MTADAPDDRFFALSLDVLCVIDLSGRYHRVNPAFERALGYSAAELCSRPLLEFVHPDDRLATERELERLARGHDSTDFENRFRARDGGERWFSWNCSAPEPGSRLAHAVARDVTERKRFEQALQMQAKVLDSMAEGVVLADAAGTICYTNPAQDEMYGFAPGELMDQHLGVLLDERPESAAQRVAEIAERARARGAWSGELASRRHDGEGFTVMARVNPLLMHARPYTIWVHEDVTERRRAELVRQRLEQMKREFVATVSHELRTPLTSIRGSLGLLAAGVLGELPEDAEEAVQIAERNCQRLVGLVNDLLDLQRAEAGRIEVEFAPLDVRGLLETSLDAVRGMAEAAGVEVEVQCQAHQVVGDRGRLVQVIVNLLGNAVKFSARGSVVRLVASEVGSFLDVRVHDHGRGVPADQLQVIFEPFRQVETSDARDKGGTGLGLAICKAIVERHGGGIGATSELGRGSTFWFRVPLSGTPAARAAAV